MSKMKTKKKTLQTIQYWRRKPESAWGNLTNQQHSIWDRNKKKLQKDDLEKTQSSIKKLKKKIRVSLG
jgi:hypothetical protein